MFQKKEIMYYCTYSRNISHLLASFVSQHASKKNGMLSWFARSMCNESTRRSLLEPLQRQWQRSLHSLCRWVGQQAKKLLPTNTVTIPRTNIAPETKVSRIPKRESSFPSSICWKKLAAVGFRDGFFSTLNFLHSPSTPDQQLLPTLYTFTGGTKSIKSLWWRCFYGAGSKVLLFLG